MKELIKVENICKAFKISKKQQALEKTDSKYNIAVDDLSFSVYEGEIFGLIGTNGAGKTTTLRILSTLIKPDKGDAFIDGESIISNPEKVRANIGFLTSEMRLDEWFTPNYLFDFFANLHYISPDIREIRKKELFKRFDIEKFAEVRVGNLSTGMKQKLSLAISLIHNPDVIIFDEPTAGLDIITGKVVVDYLLQLKNEGKTILISTHDFHLVEKICDRVAMIFNGKLALCDTLEKAKDNLTLDERFFELYFKLEGRSSEK